MNNINHAPLRKESFSLSHPIHMPTLHMMYNRSRIMKLMMNSARTTVAIPLPVNTKRIPLHVWGEIHCKNQLMY